MSRRFRFTALCFFAGVSLAFGADGLPFAAGFVVCALFFLERAAYIPLLLGCGALLIGFFWTGTRIAAYGRTQAALPLETRADLSGVIARDVEQRADAQRVTLGALSLNGAPLSGQIALSLPLLPTVSVFEKVQVACTLHKPEPLEEDGRVFHYEWFLAGQNVHATCSRPYSFTVLDSTPDIRAPGSALRASPVTLRAPLFTAKQAFLASLQRIFPEPEGSLLTGLLLGRASAQETSIRTSFAQTGLSHIVAVSGWNITMVIVLVESGLLKVMKRRYALPLVLFVVLLYVLLVGAEGSVIRAAIMGSLVASGRAFGRQGDTINILIVAAVTMIFARPFWLLFDVGFQLSLLATLGLIVASNPLAEKLRFLPSTFEIKETAAASMVAILFTLPISLWTFGTLPFFALFANLLTVPLLPFASILGGVAGLAGIVHPALGSAIGILPQGMLFFVTRVAEGFAGVPHGLLLVPGFSPWILVAAMVFPAGVMRFARRRTNA